jgi:hypothetical protein
VANVVPLPHWAKTAWEAWVGPTKPCRCYSCREYAKRKQVAP